MLFISPKIVFMSHTINDTVYTLDGVQKYYLHQRLIKDNATSTIENSLSYIYRFWIWSLANPADQNEDIRLYLARYLKNLQDGFQVYDTGYLSDFDENFEYLLLQSKPKTKSTIIKEKHAIEAFLKYLGEVDKTGFLIDKNFRSYAHAIKHGKGSGYGLKMSKYLQNILLEDASILPINLTDTKGDHRAFPFELFDELLKLANPRERLLYLLCGASAARRSQALNLTLYDIDYGHDNRIQNKRIWLIDPISNNQLGFQGIGRKDFLMHEYNINCAVDKAHKNFGFKYPIPTSYKRRSPLYWLTESYKALFFQTLIEYSPLPEGLRTPRHPFFFVTKTGERLSLSQASVTLSRHIEKLKKMFPNYAQKLDGLSFHSLRHMFGSVMATVEAKLLMQNQNEYMADYIRQFTQEAMGHTSEESTLIYFNRPWEIDIELGEYFQALCSEHLPRKSQQGL